MYIDFQLSISYKSKMINYKKIKELDFEISFLREYVLETLDCTIYSLSARTTGNLQSYMDVLHKSYYTVDQFQSAWIVGFTNVIKRILEKYDKIIDSEAKKRYDEQLKLYNAIKNDEKVTLYVMKCLERAFYKKQDQYEKTKPISDEILWLGDQSKIIGIPISLHDRSEREIKANIWRNELGAIRKFPVNYWTIGV